MLTSLAFHGPGVWYHKSTGICHTVFRSQEIWKNQVLYQSVLWSTYLHPNNCVLISTELYCVQTSFTSLDRIFYLALSSLQNVQVTFQVVLNKTCRDLERQGDLPQATSQSRQLKTSGPQHLIFP